MKLTIELVPATSWYSSVRSVVSRQEWDRLRKLVYKRDGYKCTICGGKGPKHPVEAHEIWEYDDKEKTQTLIDIVSLCPRCHQCKHIGRSKETMSPSQFDKLIQHFMMVNEIDKDEAIDEISSAFVRWSRRSEHEWEVNMDKLDDYKE